MDTNTASTDVNSTITIVHINEHQISNEDQTWKEYTEFHNEQDEHATLWTRIQRMVRSALGYENTLIRYHPKPSDPFKA